MPHAVGDPGHVDAHNADEAAIALKAPLAAPAFTGAATLDGSPVLSQATGNAAYVPAAIVAAPTGVAATDTAAFNTAHAALPASGGRIVLQRGQYDFTGGVTISKPCVVEGAGGPDALWAACATEIICTSATGTPITQTSSSVTYRQFGIRNMSGTTPTAGAGVLISAGGHNTKFLDGFAVRGFYINVDVQTAAAEWLLGAGTFLYDPVEYAIRLGGGTVDFTIAESVIIAGPAHLAPAALIRWENATGGKIHDNKLNGRGSGNALYGIDVAIPDGVGVEDVNIHDNSIEGVDGTGSYAIRVHSGGASHTGQAVYIQIHDNEISGATGHLDYGISVDPAATGLVSQVDVHNNMFTGIATTPLHVVNCDAVNLGVQSYNAATCAAPFLVQSGNTHVQRAAPAVGGAATAEVATAEATTSGSYTDLATVGPAATVDIGDSGMCLVIVDAGIFTTSAGNAGYMSFVGSGANTIAAATDNAVSASTVATGSKQSVTTLLTGLARGSTTFTAKYATDAGVSCSFNRRRITVIPL